MTRSEADLLYAFAVYLAKKASSDAERADAMV